MADFTYDDYEKIVITQKGPIYICAFNDAGNLNAMSYQQMAEFNDFLIKVRMDPDCRVIVLTGEGSSISHSIHLRKWDALNAISSSCKRSALTRW